MKKSIGQFIMELILGGGVILVMAYFFDGVYIKDYKVALLVALVLSILNTVVKPILSFIAFPITLVTLGLFQLVINGFVLSIATSVFAPDFQIESFGLTILCSIFISIFYSFLGIGKDD